MNETKFLPKDYEIRILSQDEFQPLWQAHAPKIFENDSQSFFIRDYFNDVERERAKALSQVFAQRYLLNLSLFYKGEFAGWCAGHQESGETFYMRNSAILPEHRRKGLYTALMQATVEEVTRNGFQRIYSRHVATNNAVIIPKLKFGFTISSIEISDTFGVLVHLSYFPNSLRRKIFDYRAGAVRPDEEIRKCMKL
jgi:GNAT superfamily N-acetyltransferase